MKASAVAIGAVAAGAVAVSLGKAVISAGLQIMSNWSVVLIRFLKDSSDIVQEYAKNAYMTAGLSANEYMIVTSFSASLINSLGAIPRKRRNMQTGQ